MFQKIILIVAINTYERTFKVAPSAPQRIAENNSLVVLDRDISFTLPCNFFPFVDFVFSSCVLFRLYTVFHVERTIAEDHEPPKKLKLSFRFRSFLPMCIYDTLEIPRAVASIKVVALRAKKIERQRASERERERERDRERDILPEEEVVCSCEWIRVQELGVLEQWRGKLERESAEERGELKKEEESPGGI